MCINEGLKISSILGQTVGGRALIFPASSMAVNPLNVTALLPSNKSSMKEVYQHLD
jgi:hypothetical protein